MQMTQRLSHRYLKEVELSHVVLYDRFHLVELKFQKTLP